MLIWLLWLLCATCVVDATILFLQLNKLLTLDATARGLAHPKLTGALAAGSQNGAGLLVYLALRRSHPIDPTRDRPQVRKRLKANSLIVFAVLMVTGVCALMVLLSGRV